MAAPMGAPMPGPMGGPMGAPTMPGMAPPMMMPGMNPMMMGGMNPMMGGMMGGGMNPMMMGGMNPMMMAMMGNMMAAAANSGSGGGSEDAAPKVEIEPQEPVDSRVKEICRHFNIEEKIMQKLNKAMKTREDFDEDIQVLWLVMEKGVKKNKKPTDVMLVKIREISNGTFVGKDLLDPQIKAFADKYDLDDQLLVRLVKTMKMRGAHKTQDLQDMDERIGNVVNWTIERSKPVAKTPSGLLVRMLEGLEEDGKIPPAPGWLIEAGGAPASAAAPPRRERERMEREKRERERREERDRRRSRSRSRKQRERSRSRSRSRRR
eukprot:TRINITY_DN93953_c0_g1_i1.p1 TRINITY_DN93953_c0_g1~~TRINITY_DN93953_c0_g1_i1.p1  ORF type:complete len:362 (-),score=71.93 TRINITY_DN93953_c0_g1_i1:33-992(-)